MNIRRIIFLLILFLPILTLNSMKQSHKKTDELGSRLEAIQAEVSEGIKLTDLPIELLGLIAQQLGNDFKESLKNMVILSKTSKQFHNLLRNRDSLRYLIMQRFGKNAIA